MIEKVNPDHPDKVADRIAGALVDMAYAKQDNPRIAVEVLLGHGECYIIAETSVKLSVRDVCNAVLRITGDYEINVRYREYPQDEHLAENQSEGFRCGDNGVFRGCPVTEEQRKLSAIAREYYERFKSDGKYVLDGDRLVVCQSNMEYWQDDIEADGCEKVVNPLGYWTGGSDVDCGATNRKLGSDMGDAMTGGGLHGKDLSKADVSVNVYAHLKAQELGEVVEFSCAIGDEKVGGVPYDEIVEAAREYIFGLGGFEKFAEWGLF